MSVAEMPDFPQDDGHTWRWRYYEYDKTESPSMSEFGDATEVPTLPVSMAARSSVEPLTKARAYADDVAAKSLTAYRR